MLKRIRIGAVVLLAAIPASLAWSSDRVGVVQSFLAAYNQHNVEAMMAHCTDDVRWLRVSGDMVSVEAAGKSVLRAAMQAQFANSPNTYSRLVHVNGDGPMVVAIEQARASKEAPDAFCSASVYQLDGERIQNVWYFDAYRCP